MTGLMREYWWLGVFVVVVAFTAFVVMPWLRRRQGGRG
jgi:uncharacterized membrane protein (DUF4010 family)